MSIANIKDSGNQGNNMPWQWKMLQGIQAIANATSTPLTCVDDSVTICVSAATNNLGIYGYNGSVPTPIIVNASGQLITQGSYTEDTFHTSGSPGVFVMGVRNDGNTPMTSGNGDYSPIAVNINGAIAVQDGGNSITVDGGTGTQRTPTFLRPAGTDGTIAAGTFSMSFASVGTANATVGGITLKPGETINFDAGAINNTLGAVSYVTSAPAGAELIIITLT